MSLKLGAMLVGALALVGLLTTLYFVIDGNGYDRGVSDRDREAREVITRLERKLAERMRQNENKTDVEIDCELMRLRNPKAECPK